MEKTKHKKYMKIALQEARKARDKKEVPIGAVVIKDEQLLARAHNLRESRELPTAHAELLAVNKAAEKLGSWRLENCTVYVTLEPCIMCSGVLLQARIEKLVYGADDPKSGAVKSLYNLLEDERLNHQIEVISGVFAKKSRRMLKKFFADLRGNKK